MIFLAALLISQAVAATPQQDAVNNAALAFYKYSEFDKSIDAALQRFEKEWSPKERRYAGYVVFILDSAYHRQVRIIWRFP